MTTGGCVPNIPAAPGPGLFRALDGRVGMSLSEDYEQAARPPGVRAVKVKASVKRICGSCQVIRRKGKVRVICKADPKHKQVQG